MQDEQLLFDVLLISDDEERDHALRDGLGSDPHFRLYVAGAGPASWVLASLHGVDLIVVAAGAGNEGVIRRVLDGARPDTVVICCLPDGGSPLAARADVVVPSGDPALVGLTARWLLGLPSRVLPARRTVLRRMMRS